MKLFQWKELALLAQKQSPYYRELYQGLEIESLSNLAQLPIPSQADFWNANTIKDNRLATAAIADGIVFKSGGTTGHPKFSAFTRDEWQLFTQVFGEGMSKGSLSRGDRVANLFYAGDLYASFIFIMKSIEAASLPALQLPISGSTSWQNVLKTVEDFGSNVLAGLPTTILNIAEQYAQHAGDYPQIKVDKILFGGESMYPDQRRRLQAIFPNVKILSLGYASVDAGLLGYADQSCGPDEHRVFGNATVLEIVDEETSEVIDEVDRPGKVLITNLTRGLIPIIRYPAGDRAVWKESKSDMNLDRKFLILGRAEEAARVGPVSIYYEDVQTFLSESKLDIDITTFQLVIKHFDMKDALTLKIAIANGVCAHSEAESKIAALFNQARPMFAQAVEQTIIHPLSIEWATADNIEINQRTGKMRRVIDQRSSG
jgi:phenylacetate-CoA ligase